MWCKGFVAIAIHRRISWTVVEHANESRVAIQDGEGRYFKTDVEGGCLEIGRNYNKIKSPTRLRVDVMVDLGWLGPWHSAKISP